MASHLWCIWNRTYGAFFIQISLFLFLFDRFCILSICLILFCNPLVQPYNFYIATMPPLYNKVSKSLPPSQYSHLKKLFVKFWLKNFRISTILFNFVANCKLDSNYRSQTSSEWWQCLQAHAMLNVVKSDYLWRPIQSGFGLGKCSSDI